MICSDAVIVVTREYSTVNERKVDLTSTINRKSTQSIQYPRSKADKLDNKCNFVLHAESFVIDFLFYHGC